MLQILQGCFPRSEELRIFFDVTFAICIALCFMKHIKRQKAGLKNPAYFIF